MHPRRRRVGQDPGAHPPHRPPGGRRARRPPPRPRPHLHPQGRGRAGHPPRARSGCATGRRPAPSTPWPAPSSRTLGRPGGRRRPRCSTARVGSLARSSARTSRITAPSWRREIEWARARLVAPATGTPRAAAAADRRTGRSVDRVAVASLRALRGREAPAPGRSTSTTCSPTVRRRPWTTDPTFAAAQRWRFRHLFVDEFQDVNPLQHRLLTGWLGDRRRPVRRRRPQPGHLPAGTAPTPRSSRASPAPPRRPRSSSSRDNYRSTPQILGRRRRRARRRPAHGR